MSENNLIIKLTNKNLDQKSFLVAVGSTVLAMPYVHTVHTSTQNAVMNNCNSQFFFNQEFFFDARREEADTVRGMYTLMSVYRSAGER